MQTQTHSFMESNAFLRGTPAPLAPPSLPVLPANTRRACSRFPTVHGIHNTELKRGHTLYTTWTMVRALLPGKTAPPRAAPRFPAPPRAPPSRQEPEANSSGVPTPRRSPQHVALLDPLSLQMSLCPFKMSVVR